MRICVVGSSWIAPVCEGFAAFACMHCDLAIRMLWCRAADCGNTSALAAWRVLRDRLIGWRSLLSHSPLTRATRSRKHTMSSQLVLRVAAVDFRARKTVIAARLAGVELKVAEGKDTGVVEGRVELQTPQGTISGANAVARYGTKRRVAHLPCVSPGLA